ncbi:hypothetical protein [Paenibacillus solani]|uniref:Uncharacterized protein n=1 Tax=Paenibacillus solani TaxID=1705565 RepID=A0A0M1NZL7_9BACL|nr:hypothetical protein [Paenibacillus solani]KOR87708.1 hypothetical protein AM231_00185 [Paenibacillus solani]
MKAMKYRHLTLCDSYEHSQVIPKKNAKRIFEKIVQVYTNREDIDDRYKSSNMFQGIQKIDNDTLLIVVSIESAWWKPNKGLVREDVYYFTE